MPTIPKMQRLLGMIKELPFFSDTGAIQASKLTPEQLKMLDEFAKSDQSLVFRGTPGPEIKPPNNEYGMAGLFAARNPSGVMRYTDPDSESALHILRLDKPHKDFPLFNLNGVKSRTYDQPDTALHSFQFPGPVDPDLGASAKTAESIRRARGMRFANNGNLMDSGIKGEIGLFDPDFAKKYHKDGTPAVKLLGPNLDEYEIKYAEGGAVNHNPTDAQKHAGNYKKRHDRVLGMDISIENEAGSHRTGVDRTGRPWKQQLSHDYGYIRGTKGRDKDHLDVYLGPHHTKGHVPVHVIDQIDPHTKEFDEHKVMLGFKTPREASAAYHQNFEPGWTGAGKVVQMTMPEFKAWAFAPGRRVKPASMLVQTTPAKPPRKRKVQQFAEGGQVADESLGGALTDPQFYKDLWRNTVAVGNRATAGLLGAPVDLTDMVLKGNRALLKAAGIQGGNAPLAEHPILGSEWLMNKMNGVGIPTSTGNSTADMAGDLGTAALTMSPGKIAPTLSKVGKAALEPIARGMEGQGALSKVLAPIQPAYAVKSKGGNWMGGYTQHQMSPEDLANDFFRVQNGQPRKEIADWGSKQFARYLKNDFGTPTDPMLRLEQEGRLHFDPDEAAANWGMNPSGEQLAVHKKLTGRDEMTPLESLQASMVYSDTPKGLRENILQHMSDAAENSPHGEWNEMPKTMSSAAWAFPESDLPAKNSYLDKLVEQGNKDPVHSFDFTASMDDPMQFLHVRDYLDRALSAHHLENTFDGLEALRGAMHGMPDPRGYIQLIERNLHLSAEQLARSSVADIIGKTAEWDKLLGKQKQLEDLNKGIKTVHKTYPDGHQWVELDPEGLKAEGQAMKHCVGGYCSEVSDGRTKILSLRDSDGKPKVTVELKPKYGDHGADPAQDHEMYTPEAFAALEQLAGKYGAKIPVSEVQNPDLWPHQIMEGNTWVRNNIPADYSAPTATEGMARIIKFTKELEDWKKQFPRPVISHDINQIKGPANRKPSDDVIPHVQDLVQGGVGDMNSWGKVSDLHNTGFHGDLTQYAYPKLTTVQTDKFQQAAKLHPGKGHEDFDASFRNFIGNKRFYSLDDMENWIKSLKEAKNGGQ